MDWSLEDWRKQMFSVKLEILVHSQLFANYDINISTNSDKII